MSSLNQDSNFHMPCAQNTRIQGWPIPVAGSISNCAFENRTVIAEIRYPGSMQETMEAAESKTQFAEVFKSIIEHAGTRIVYGEPVSVIGKTVLPVATMRYGFGGSSGAEGSSWQHGGGGGGGLVAKLLGVVEITQSQARFIPIVSSRALVIAVGVGVCLGFLAASRRG
jgi:uncharacterized spore protein YtfJ